jgi:RNA polymerase sigma factor (sigma-70 family)
VEGPTDADVIGASLDDPRQFASVYDRHAAVVFRFLVRRVGRETADELLGDTFRIAFERRADFDVTRPSARPWLYGIATNLVAKHRRTEMRRLNATARLSSDTSPESFADNVAAVVDAGGVWPAVARGIADLPDGERDALLLYAWEELSYDEIAAALAIPVGTVRSRLNRARGRLRELTGTTGEQPASKPPAPRTRIAP